ncbi:hypothetical protein M1555_04640 [Patescibacteria group bacterium]|nr:hypothetical protein [Patescibacteria group bacterium]
MELTFGPVQPIGINKIHAREAEQASGAVLRTDFFWLNDQTQRAIVDLLREMALRIDGDDATQAQAYYDAVLNSHRNEREILVRDEQDVDWSEVQHYICTSCFTIWHDMEPPELVARRVGSEYTAYWGLMEMGPTWDDLF